jgi:4-hydroxybenzoate polyprenyltransferase
VTNSNKFFSLVEALRPNQWIKNLSLFAAGLLNGQLFVPEILAKSILAFIVFSLLSSASYLINDAIDAPKDRNHPVKKFRPIARGDIAPLTAVLTSFVLLFIALSIAAIVNPSFFYLSLFFILLQYSYSLFFKKKAILDIIGIAFFFIIRAYAGEIATGFHLPVWIMLTVIFLALFIASGKRRSELFNSGTKSRQSLENYNKNLLNFYTSIFAVSTLIAYAMFTFLEEPVSFEGIIHNFLLSNYPNALDRKWYMVTLIPVIFGIMRYGQIIFEMQEGERPERVIATDLPLLFSVLLWGLMMMTIIYVL